jgi:hypothetical protein
MMHDTFFKTSVIPKPMEAGAVVVLSFSFMPTHGQAVKKGCAPCFEDKAY